MKENYTLFYNLALRGCDTLLNLLGKAEAHIKENNLQETDLLDGRLIGDMFNFTKQVQVFTDGAVGGVYRLAGMEKPSMPDTEKTFAELVARVNTAKSFIQKVNPSEVVLDEKRQIKLGWMKDGQYFEGKEFLENFLFPNVMFHLTTAYAILRMKGVKIGKFDYLGKVDMKGV